MYRIACTRTCLGQATTIADGLGDSQVVVIDDIVRDPESLGDFENLGLVFEREGKGIPQSVVSFIEDVLGSCDLKGLEHMFSICVCDGKPMHALKMVEKLCARIGCAPSLSDTLTRDSDVGSLVSRIKAGDIQLAKGSLGTMFYMKARGLRIK